MSKSEQNDSIHLIHPRPLRSRSKAIYWNFAEWLFILDLGFAELS